MKELIMVSEQNVNAIYLDNIQGNKANRLVGGVGKKCRGDGGGVNIFPGHHEE